MTEREAIEIITNSILESENAIAQLLKVKGLAERKERMGEYYSNIQNCKKEIEACKVSIKALEEIQEYRKIGTLEEVKAAYAELSRWHTDKVNENIKNVFANTSTLICHNCDHKDEYIEELEFEVCEYEAIGTVEEMQELKERMNDGWILCEDRLPGDSLSSVIGWDE